MSRIARVALLCVAPLIAVGLLCVFAFLVADAVLPFPEARLRRAPATIVYDRDGAPLRIVLPRDEIYRMPVTLDEVPPELPRALIASEDRYYREAASGSSGTALQKRRTANRLSSRIPPISSRSGARRNSPCPPCRL